MLLFFCISFKNLMITFEHGLIKTLLYFNLLTYLSFTCSFCIEN
jgi:hypothetical protein